MSKLAQAGDISTASPARACRVASDTACSIDSAANSSTPAGSSTARMAGASRPIRTAARTWRATGAASGSKSCPLPSPPRITTSLRLPPVAPGSSSVSPRPRKAATVAPTLVPLLSSKYSIWLTIPTDSTRCGSPRYSRSPNSIGPSGQPAALASASAASALTALWRPRIRSASTGIKRWMKISSTSSVFLRRVSSASCARTSQAMPLTSSMP